MPPSEFFMFLPQVAYASNHIATAQGFLDKINEFVLFPLIVLMMATALLIFLWGCFEYVLKSTSDEGRETGRRHILWGVIGMLVMLSAYSILTIAAGTFNLQGELNRTDAPDSGVGSNPFTSGGSNPGGIPTTGTNHGGIPTSGSNPGGMP